MAEEKKQVWERIISVHQITKKFTLLAEECDTNFNTFLQPINELKNALEHIIRATSAEIGFTAEKDATYVIKNLDKALGHEYRAFFDTADWLSINLRKRIIELLRPYDDEVISQAIPKYFSEIRPRIDEICNEIAKIRDTKDIGNSKIIIPVAEEYEAVLNELITYEKTIKHSVPAMIELNNKKRYKHTKLIITNFIVGFLSALLVAFLIYILGLNN